MASELRDAIVRIDAAQLGGESLDDEPEYRAVELVTNTARKYANPDYIVARDRIVPLIAAMLDEGDIECAVIAREAVDAALGITDTAICVHCGGTGAGEVQTPWKTNPCHHCGGSGEAPDGQ